MLFLVIDFFCCKVEEQQERIENLCSKLNCNYPGSYCSVENGAPKCVCDAIVCESDGQKICGQDGQTYASKCDLLKFSCAKQIEIEIAHVGHCSQGNFF